LSIAFVIVSVNGGNASETVTITLPDEIHLFRSSSGAAADHKQSRQRNSKRIFALAALREWRQSQPGRE